MYVLSLVPTSQASPNFSSLRCIGTLTSCQTGSIQPWLSGVTFLRDSLYVKLHSPEVQLNHIVPDVSQDNYVQYSKARGATVKAGMQERGREVMWFHTGNYTEVMINGSFPAATSCNSTAIFCRPSSLSFRQI